MPNEKGETRRERNERFHQPPSPEPDVPEVYAHVWDWFWRLNKRRQDGMSSPQPLPAAEIESWASQSGIVIDTDEFQALEEMDSAYLSESAKESKANRELAEFERQADK